MSGSQPASLLRPHEIPKLACPHHPRGAATPDAKPHWRQQSRGWLASQHTKCSCKEIQSKPSLCLCCSGLVRASLGASPGRDLKARQKSARPCSHSSCTSDLYTRSAASTCQHNSLDLNPEGAALAGTPTRDAGVVSVPGNLRVLPPCWASPGNRPLLSLYPPASLEGQEAAKKSVRGAFPSPSHTPGVGVRPAARAP